MVRMKRIGDAVAFGAADEGGAGLGAQEGDLVLEVAAHVLGAVVVADGETGGGLAYSAEAGTDALEDGFQHLEAGGAAGGMDPDEFAGAVVHRDEDGHLAVPEGGGGGGRRCPTVPAPATTTRDLAGLVALGALSRSGAGRHTPISTRLAPPAGRDVPACARTGS